MDFLFLHNYRNHNYKQLFVPFYTQIENNNTNDNLQQLYDRHY